MTVWGQVPSLESLSATLSSGQLAEELITPALESIGQKWEKGDVALAQVYMSGKICEELVESMFHGKADHVIDHPPIGIAVLQDFHLLGKRLVYSMLRAHGFQLIDLGYGIGPEAVCKAAVENNIRILLISTLMLPAALNVVKIREYFEEQDYACKIIVGGAPFNFDSQLWKDVRADAYASTASGAVQAVETIIREMEHGN